MDPWAQFPDAQPSQRGAPDAWDQFPDVGQAGPRKAQYDAIDPRIEASYDGAAGRVLRGVPLLGGALDEIGARGDAAFHYLSGGRTGEPYDAALARRRDLQKASDAEHPIRNTVEALAGGAALTAGLPVARVFQSGSPTLNAAGNFAITGGGYAGLSGFAEGEGGFENRLETAKNYAGTGAAISAALGVGGQRLVNRYSGTAPHSVARDAGGIGVTVPQFMEGGRASRSIAGKLGAIPFVGDDINAAVSNTRRQLSDATENIADRVAGPGNLPQEAGEAVRNSASQWADDGARAIQDRVYAPVNQAMQGVVAPINNTRAAVSELARQQTQAAAPIHARAIREVEEAVTRPGGLSFEGMTRLRTRIGSMVDNTIDPENRTSAAGLRALYAGLSRDMEEAIAANGGPRAQQAWQRANGITRQIAERRDNVARLVGANGDKSGEGITDRIVAMASTKSSADAARLMQIRRVAGADAWRQISGNAIIRLGRNQSNEFSPDIFLKNYTQLSHRGRQLLFDSTGDRQLTGQLDALANVSRALQQFNRLGNPSGTGGVAALLAALTGAATGDMGATLGGAIAGRGIGMLMSRPAVVRAANVHARNMLRAANGRATQAVIAASAANLARITAKETGEDERDLTRRILEATR